MNIEEGLVSNMAEIYKVSKQVSNPILSITKALSRVNRKTDPSSLRKQIKSQMNVITKSKMSNGMKDKFINNFRLDMYNTLLDGGFGTPDAGKFLNWNLSTLHAIQSLAQR